MDPMQISSLHNEALLIQAKFKTKTKTSILAKMTLAATVWHIWKEKNMRILQLQQSNKIMVFRRLYEDIGLLLRTCNWKVDRDKAMKAILSNWKA